MIGGDVLIVLGVAILVVAVLVGGLGWRRYENGPVWDAAIFVFLVLYPALWAAKLWIVPAGPVFLGTHWLPILVAGLMVAFTIGATAPRRRRRRKEIVIGPVETPGTPARMPFGLYFWLLMFLYLVALVAGYYASRTPT